MSRLLVLGASRYQLETIRAARALGHEVVTTDNCPGNAGHALAHRSYGVSTVDREGVRALAEREAVDGVIAPCTDVAVPTAAYVAESLGLPGPALAGAETACDKLAFRAFQRRHGFPAPESLAVDDRGRADVLLPRGRFVLKPSDSSGCKGVFVIETRAELLRRLPSTLAWSAGRKAIVERFLEGHQGSCQGLLQGGELAILSLTERATAAAPYATTCAHSLPFPLSARAQRDLVEQLREMWRLLRIPDGPFDCDFVVTRSGVQVLELSPRLGGTGLASLLRHSMGLDLAFYAIAHALGQRPEPPARNGRTRPAAALILGVPRAGHLRFERAAAAGLRREPWVRALGFDYPRGARVPAFTNGRDRVGEALVTASSREELDARVRGLLRRLRLASDARPAAAEAGWGAFALGGAP
jgi:biotin carboxylase